MLAPLKTLFSHTSHVDIPPPFQERRFLGWSWEATPGQFHKQQLKETGLEHALPKSQPFTEKNASLEPEGQASILHKVAHCQV